VLTVATAEPLNRGGKDPQGMILELREVVANLHRRLTRLEKQVTTLSSLVPIPVDRPPIEYIVHGLPQHPSDRYQARSLDQITHIAVHHSATRDTVTAAQMARYHVNELDWPGIGYHFLISVDGTIQQTNELTSVSYHAREANRTSLGICFIGDFKEVVPPETQLASGGHLIAWLMQELDIPLENVDGHKRYVPSTSCPGDQWDSGQKWGELLHARIQEWRPEEA
jgi:N-acetyl-anhydromuramyl-L-alanine amidase AmpD